MLVTASGNVVGPVSGLSKADLTPKPKPADWGRLKTETSCDQSPQKENTHTHMRGLVGIGTIQ